MKPSIHIIGNGYFGTFLKNILDPYVVLDENSDHKILAVPFESYEAVARSHSGKHLINVCSVQEETNSICLSHSDRVTGFHPLFGPRSPKEGRSGIVTHLCNESEVILEVFESIGCHIVKTIHGRPFDGQTHDEIMAKTHGLIVWFHQHLQNKVGEIKDIPEDCLPPSFKALKSFKDFVNELGDFSPGTLSSIKANRYFPKT